MIPQTSRSKQASGAEEKMTNGTRGPTPGSSRRSKGTKRSGFKRRLRKFRQAVTASLASLMQALTSPARLPSAAGRKLLKVFGQWQKSTNFRQLVRGLPALATLIASLMFIAYQYFRVDDIRARLAGRYLRAAVTAVEAKEDQTA